MVGGRRSGGQRIGCRTRTHAVLAPQTEYGWAAHRGLERPFRAEGNVVGYGQAGDRHVADLAGTAGRTTVELTTDHKRHPDARADPQVDEVCDILSGTRHTLGDGCEID